ncbi:MAG: LysR family transcriptional regulator [Methylomicrobium sp.]
MAALNYHHLRYFWMIASENNLTRAAEKLHISQSSLSIQLRKLEDALGQNLFEREGKRLVLTEAGHIALDYANTIFKTGDELVSLMHSRESGNRQIVRIGVVSTLSRNFQLELLKPLLIRNDTELVLHSGNLKELLTRMQNHTLDLVLANQPSPTDADIRWYSHLLNEQPVSLVCNAESFNPQFRFPDDLQAVPLLLPGIESGIRAAFDSLLEQVGVRPKIVAEVDDMAMLRLLARESGNLALVPPVVVRDELVNGILVECWRISEIKERFYAITPNRRFPNAIVKELLKGLSKEMLK